MTTSITSPATPQALPDHTQLPDSDGRIVENYQEHPQGCMLSDAVRPALERLHPDEQFSIGHDSGIYWRLTDPPLRGCKSPDWFYVPGVPPMLNGRIRRSYVLWHEHVPPFLVIEFVSGDGQEERDQTPETGKFWVYEHGIRARYYAIFEQDPGRVELHQLVSDSYERVPPNERGHYPIPELGLELGIWQGHYKGMDAEWLRWFDSDGHLLPNYEERLEQGHRDKEQAERRAEQERRDKEQAERRAALLAARLRAFGLNPDEP